MVILPTLSDTYQNQVHYYEDESAPTGTCAVCVVGGERLVSSSLL
jgi:hypothetical protein